jgi:DNA segregation ATPase FtsK/SpoIIIE and related proteins
MYRTTLFAMMLCFLFPQCSDQKKDSGKTTDNNSSNSTTTAEEIPAANNTTASTSSSGDLIGTWKLQLDAFDDNNNRLLDPEERAKATPNNTSYQFKPDGSCVIQGMFKGRYELKKENGNDNVIVYREKMAGEEEDDPQPEKFRILSVSSEELVLLMQESHNENTIWIFKRVWSAMISH